MVIKKLYLLLLSLSIFTVAGKAIAAEPFQFASHRTDSQHKLPQHKQKVQVMISDANSLSVTELAQKQILGNLGQPLGKIITISGVVRQAGISSKSLQDVLSVEAVNGIPLAQPVLIEFHLFVTAQVPKPLLARSFKYVGYETGGFNGVPTEAFKYVPALATTGHEFNTSFQILREELDIVRTEADLMRFSDRRVEVIGRYVSHTTPAPAITSSIDFKGNYTTAKIVLEDGTEIPIYPSSLKQSLRSSEEVKTHDGKIVRVVGQTQRQKKSPPRQGHVFISVDGIWNDNLAP